MRVKPVYVSEKEKMTVEYFENNHLVICQTSRLEYLTYPRPEDVIEIIDMSFVFDRVAVMWDTEDETTFEILSETNDGYFRGKEGILMRVTDKELWGITYQCKGLKDGKIDRFQLPNHTFGSKGVAAKFIQTTDFSTMLDEGCNEFEFSDFKPVLIDSWIEE